MNILILGATGFIGSAIASRLVADGHLVTGLGRNPARAALKQLDIRWLQADLATMTEPGDWAGILKGHDAIINSAGALQDGLADDVTATQAKAMQALYAEAKQSPIRLIVQISARTQGAAAELPFLATKRQADEALVSSGVPYVILRPALVLGRNAHGGSALLRALSAFPVILPLVYAKSHIATVSVEDVATAVAEAITGDLSPGTDVGIAAKETLTLAELVCLHRQWLGLPPGRVVAVPDRLGKPVSWLADIAGRLGWRSPLRSTAMKVMSEGVSTDSDRSVVLPAATAAAAILSANPSGVQDLWFARLYLLKPLVIVGLALFWLLSGVIPLIDPERASSHFLPLVDSAPATALTIATCLIDIALGLAVVVRPWTRNALLGMLVVTFAYLVGGSLLEPALWLDPLGPLVKVLPSILLILVALATLDER
jgi:uncharacterized protein YbjT (DUF2867 family)